MALPDWITRTKDGVFVVDTDTKYPEVLEELGVSDDEIDQYWLEVAYQIARADARLAIKQECPEHRVDKMITLKMQGEKERWKQQGKPRGKGPEAASRGRQWREHYKRLRGFVIA